MKLIFTLALCGPILAFAYSWINRRAVAEAGLIANMAIIGGIALWAGWSTAAIVYLLWHS